MKPFLYGFLFFTLFVFALESFAKDGCSVANSQDTETQVISTDVPSHLKGAIIMVILADGSASVVPAEKFKVVPRKQQHLVTKVTQVVSCNNTVFNKNRISVLGGYGAKDGLKRSNSSDSVTIESKTGVVGGVQYQRSLSEKISVGVQGQSNKTGSLMIGLDF